MTKLTEFLLARIAEDEAWAREHESLGDFLNFSEDVCARVLAECEAKRRIVEDFIGVEADKAEALARGDKWRGDVWLSATCRAIQHLAVIYADHPDFDESWRL